MAWKSDNYIGEPSPVAVGDNVTFTGANYGATRSSHSFLPIMLDSKREYNLAETKARTVANGKIVEGSETRAAYVGRRIQIVGDPQRDLRVNFVYSNAARSRIYGVGTARSTTMLSVLRDGTGIPEVSSPDVISFTYPIDITPSADEILQTRESSDLDSLVVTSDEIEDGDILRIGVGAFSGISTYASVQTLSDVSNGDDEAAYYDGMIEYSSLELEWL